MFSHGRSARSRITKTRFGFASGTSVASTNEPAASQASNTKRIIFSSRRMRMSQLTNQNVDIE
jgi:hypothetical protein